MYVPAGLGVVEVEGTVDMAEAEMENCIQLFRDMPLYGAPQMDKLMNYVVAEFPSIWELVGIQLKISTDKLDAIKTNTSLGGEPQKMFCEVIKLWENNHHLEAPFNWETILNALASPSVNRRAQAESIATKIRNSTPKQNNSLEDCNSKINDVIQGFHDREDSDMSSSVSGLGYYTEDDIKKLCGCGNCSLDQIITRGCSHPDLMPRFPLLDLHRLPDCKLQQYIFTLEEEAVEINKAFAALLDDVSISMTGRIPVKNVVNFIKASRYIDTTILPTVAPELKQKLDKAEDIADVFSVMTDICSWFNHHPLESLVERYGSENDKHTYDIFKKEKLMRYLQRSITEIPKDGFGPETIEGSGTFKLKLDHSTAHEIITGEQILYLKGKIAKALDIPIHCLNLHSIRKGCLELEYSIPLALYTKCFFPFSTKCTHELASIVIGPNNALICLKSIWYEGEYHDIPFKSSDEIGSVDTIDNRSTADLVSMRNTVQANLSLQNSIKNDTLLKNEAACTMSSFMEELQSCLDERSLTLDDLHFNKLNKDILCGLSKHMDDLDISGFWQTLPFKEKKLIRLKNCTVEERRMCIFKKWSEVMGNNATYYHLVSTLNECGSTVRQVLDCLREIKNTNKKISVLPAEMNVTRASEFSASDAKALNLLSVQISESQIVSKFSVLLDKVVSCLCNQPDIDIDELVLYILSRQRISFLVSSSQLQEHVRGIVTKEDVMELIKCHVNWFNHSFLGSFVNEFNIASESYKTYVMEDLCSLLIKSLLEVPVELGSPCESPSQFAVQLSLSPQHKISAYVLISLKAHVAYSLGVSIDTIDLCSYNSDRLVFSAPCELLHSRRPLLVGHIIGAILTIPSFTVDKKLSSIESEEVIQEFSPHVFNTVMTEIDRAFASLIVLFVKCIKRVSFDKVKEFIINEFVIQLFIREVGVNYTPFFSHILINDIHNIRDLLIFLGNYWSFLNFALLEKFVKRFGSKEVKNALAKYSNHLKEISLSNLPNYLHHLPKVDGFFSDTVTVKMESSFFTKSAGELLLVHDKVSQTLNLQKFAVLLWRIKKEESSLEFLVADTGGELTRSNITILKESFIVCVQFQGAELKSVDDDDDDDFNDNDSGVGCTTDYSDTESFYQDINDNEDQQPSSLDSEVTCIADDETIISSPIVDLKNDVLENNSSDDWPSFEDTRNHSQANKSRPELSDTVKSNSALMPGIEKLIHVTPNPYKGVIQVCDICLSCNSFDESLLTKKCHHPESHDFSSLIYAAWDSSLKQIIHINPRPLAPVRDLFHLCDSTRCRGGSLCTFAHNQVECDAWNYDLIKERERFGLPSFKPTSPPTTPIASLPSNYFTFPNSNPFNSHRYGPESTSYSSVTGPSHVEARSISCSSFVAGSSVLINTADTIGTDVPVFYNATVGSPLYHMPLNQGFVTTNFSDKQYQSGFPLHDKHFLFQGFGVADFSDRHYQNITGDSLHDTHIPINRCLHTVDFSVTQPNTTASGSFAPTHVTPRYDSTADFTATYSNTKANNPFPITRKKFSIYTPDSQAYYNPSTKVPITATLQGSAELPQIKRQDSNNPHIHNEPSALYKVDFPPLPSKVTSFEANQSMNEKPASLYSSATTGSTHGAASATTNTTSTTIASRYGTATSAAAGSSYGAASVVHEKSKQKFHFKEREEWKLSFSKRLTHTVLHDEIIEPELSSSNYRDKFYYLLCFEESEHISVLTDKCDGQYEIQICSEIRGTPSHCICRVRGMNDDQVQYAVQASEAVYFIDFKNNEKRDICTGTIHPCNFRDIDEYFYVSLLMEDFQKIYHSNVSRVHGLMNSWCKVHMEFEVKHSYFNGLHQAVISIPDSMIKKITPSTSSSVVAVLDRSTQHINPVSPFSDISIDKYEQYDALKAILTCSSNLPVVVSGPFGSGKTRILARAAYEFSIEGLSSSNTLYTRILICAHHINTIETYLSKYLEPALSSLQIVKIVRIVRKDEFQLKSYSASNIVNRTISDFKKEVYAGQYISDPVLIIVSTYMSSLQVAKVLSKYHFTHILLDEAAQVREPEAIAALSLGNAKTKVVIAGDSKQVGPSVLVLGNQPNNYGLSISLLERLEELYKNNFKEGRSFPHITYLNRNYRCHQNVVDFLSQVIYKYPIISASRIQQTHPLVPFPCIFYWSSAGNTKKDPRIVEAEAVCEQARRYFSNWRKKGKEVSKKDMCIISPFRTQLNIIKSKLHTMKGITLLPSYTIQGHEFEALILSTLEPLQTDGTSSNPTKSLVNPKIFNTAISRCKSFVVVVGDPFVLLKAEKQFPERCWQHYLKLCLEKQTLFFSKSYHQHKKSELKERLMRELK